MTFLTLLGWLKTSKDFLKKIISFLWEYKTLVVIALLLFMLSVMRNDIEGVIDEKEAVQKEFHDYKLEQEKKLLQEQIKTKEKEVELLKQQNKLEVDHAKKIQNLQNDVVTSRTVANSLSEQLSEATKRVDVAECREIRDYSKTVTKLLEDVSTRRDYYATRAEQHAIAEENAVAQHNLLVDTLHNK